MCELCFAAAAAAAAETTASGSTDSTTLRVASVGGVSTNQLAQQLVEGYWSNAGYPPLSLTPGADGTVRVNLAGLDGTGAALARVALDRWSEVSGLTFVETAQKAQITFSDGSSGAYTSFDYDGALGWTASINVSQSWLVPNTSGFLGVTSYGLQAYLHEIGHALGLGHAGNYNGYASFGVDNLFAFDSWQLSVMSYFDQGENTSVDASFAYIVTPMLADIVAVREIYGLATDTNAGNSRHDLAAMLGAYSEGSPVAFTLADDNGWDVIDASGLTGPVALDLDPQSASSIGGLIGNLVIARDSWIEAAVGTDLGDLILGNRLANRLEGGGGADTLAGGRGCDRLFGDDGEDSIEGGGGADRIRAGAGDDQALAGGGNDRAWGEAGNDRLCGASGMDTLSGQGGDDSLRGGAGADVLFGGGGSDYLIGGGGDDHLSGGAGGDRFVHRGQGQGLDWIDDFSAIDGDLLVFRIDGAVAEDFSLLSGADLADAPDTVADQYVMHLPSGMLLFALADVGDTDVGFTLAGSLDVFWFA